MEDIFVVPLLEHFFVYVTQVELVAFCEFLAHIVCFVIYLLIWVCKGTKYISNYKAQ